MSGYHFKDETFPKDYKFNYKSGDIIIENCIFEGKFYIILEGVLDMEDEELEKKRIKISKLKIIDSTFKENVKFHGCEINNFKIDNVDFKKNADFYKSKFNHGVDGQILFKSINFQKLALFGDVIFCQEAFFKYVTFEDYAHFKSSEFKKGLDLELANIAKVINFYGIKLDYQENTLQETYRIIKNEFIKAGNHIEANKYHACELQRRKEKSQWNDPNRWSLCLHGVSSNYGQNWLLPIFWIFMAGIIFTIINNLYTYPMYKEELIENIFKYMSLFNLKVDELFGNTGFLNYFLFMLHKIVLGYLYYQVFIAFRKDTRK